MTPIRDGFEEFPKIARLRRECFVTEKIDGTNAQVFIVEAAPPAQSKAPRLDATDEIISPIATTSDGKFDIYAGSRNRWITPASDNFGFAAWVVAHAEELAALGPGRHFGEWWGAGIQRGYGLREKRFSLFNVTRWHAAGEEPRVIASGDPRAEPKRTTEVPACCGVVPVLYRGEFKTHFVEAALDYLAVNGSVASPGFANPEGVVVYHVAGGVGFKVTIEKDEEPKGLPR